jgi:hypothetical protein
MSATKKCRIGLDLAKFNPWSASYIYTVEGWGEGVGQIADIARHRRE